MYYERTPTVFTHLVYYSKEIFPLYIHFRIGNFREFSTHLKISIGRKLPDIRYVSPLTQLKSNEMETIALNNTKPKFSQKLSVLVTPS